jgi:putative oxygen-independent coproporphyrinogen III oxidase
VGLPVGDDAREDADDAPGRFGVYIHFPFCRARCPYCDFATDVRAAIPHTAYADALLQELAVRAPVFEKRVATTLYVGGGTPGLWDPHEFARVATAVAGTFGAPREVTIEINPGESEPPQLARFRRHGVTRLSIGVQSLQDSVLRSLGRLHTAQDARRAVLAARSLGFPSLSCDLIFGAPQQTLESWRADLAALIALEPDHVSVYGLTVEAGTPFGQLRVAGKLTVPDGDAQADMYEAAIDDLERAGYRQYEISNFARSHHRSRHNQMYWTGSEYLGLGVAAHSRRAHVDGSSERFANPAHWEAYLDGPGQNAMHEHLDAQATQREAIWLGLRQRHGVTEEAIAWAPANLVVDLMRDRLIERADGRIRLTRRGLLLGDRIAARFLA